MLRTRTSGSVPVNGSSSSPAGPIAGQLWVWARRIYGSVLGARPDDDAYVILFLFLKAYLMKAQG
jgi:hypothetical protein